MCRRSKCDSCQKATWFGCGAHVPTVMDPIAETDRCSCEPKVEKEGKKYPPSSATGMIKAVFGLGSTRDETAQEEL